MPHAIAFIGASSGCGLAALQHALAAGHTCIALCRVPSKLSAHFPSPPPNLTILTGNAHDSSSVASCLVHPSDPTRLVDAIHVSVGAQLDLATRTLSDPDVCKKAAACVLAALTSLRESGGRTGRPLFTAVSTTGISKFGRDVPLGMLPLYKWLLGAPHADKEVMEERMAASGERVVLVRPSFLKDGARPETRIRVGVEDLVKGVEKKEIGYFVAREDVGRWVYENLLRQPDECQYEARPGHVYLATYDAVTNKFAIIHDLAIPGCPSWLAVDHARSLVYIVDEDSHNFHRFHLDPSSDTPFSQKLTVDTASSGAVYLAFSQDKQRLLGAAFAGGAVDVWDVSDGVKLEKAIVADGKPGPVAHIQDAPHPHQVLLDPTGRFYVVPDLGTDEILVVDSKDDAFTISSRVTVEPPGSGPRHGAFYPVGASPATHYILLCELVNAVVVYALHYTDSTLEFTQVSETCSFGSGGPSVGTARAGHLELLRDNKHLYVTNRLTGRASDSVAYLRVHTDGAHPRLEFVQGVQTCGLLPRMFCVLDAGRGNVVGGE
ncbi:Uncharacterized protein YkgB [Beauveria bassiana D1-5]|uniref:Uncharacterized protein YkgB n=1 Tax=Beauveria bassiana D1-5 TaxID=1245745 RepID=A0A0A2VVI7_BEABA|nr:Uncharacterized protein YkgB [Beauveria bassiana D1-5]